MKNKVVAVSIFILMVFAGMGSYYYFQVYLPGKNEVTDRQISEIKRKVWSAVVEEILLDPLLIIKKGAGKVPDYTARMPLRFTPVKIKEIFNGVVAPYKKGSVEYMESDTMRAKEAYLKIKYGNETIFKIRFLKNSKPKIAIILDDWGYSNRNFKYLSRIEYPFTAAVLPGLAYTKQASMVLGKRKKEIILHLPMQPKRNLPLEKNTIGIDAMQGNVDGTINGHIESVMGAVGVNNHQGSLATEDVEVMKMVMRTLKKKNLFFIDSVTTGQSVVLEAAKVIGVLSGQRNVFIDNEKYLDYIEGQFLQLKRQAKKRGYAIGIGHDNDVTLRAMERYMPALENEGFEFVYVSELVQ